MSSGQTELRRMYAMLDVPLHASPSEVRSGYLAAVKRWHPDRFPAGSEEQSEAATKIREINGAYRRIKHAPLRFVVGTRPREADRVEVDVDFASARSSGPDLRERWLAEHEAIGTTTGWGRRLAYVHLAAVCLNLLLLFLSIYFGWDLIEGRTFRRRPSLPFLFPVVGLTMHAIELRDQLRGRVIDRAPSVLEELFSGVSFVTFAIYPFWSLAMSLIALAFAQYLMGGWLALSALVLFALRRELRALR